ncbi:MAG: hypothetical protein ACYDA9_17470 [Terriglobia bacterium]
MVWCATGTIGAVTDVASAIIKDPAIVDRIRALGLAFRSWPNRADEFNVANFVKLLRVNDFSKPCIIWDILVLTCLKGPTTQETYPRTVLKDDKNLEHSESPRKVT